MGVAGSAPAYSIAATTFALFGAVLYGGAAALLYCGFFMFGIVFAFKYLSKNDSHAGASYSWVRRALHPVLGYLAGWAVVISAMIFMVIATFPAGSSMLSLFSSSAAQNKSLITIFGTIFFLLMVGAVAAGVTVTVTVQIIMSCIEVFLLLLFALLAIFHAHHVTAFSWHWFSPSVFRDHGSSGFVAGALLAAFYYWGWDVTANLNEETKNAKSTSGTGGVLGALVVFLLFEVFTVATNMVLTPAQLTDNRNAADILVILGQAVWHGTGGKLIVVAVLLSTIATLETTLIQVTRTMFTMGRDNTLPKVLGRIHPVRKTPLVATAVVTVISVLLFIGSQYIGSISNIMSDGYNAIGLQICIYYGLAGLSVVVLYRRQLFSSLGNFIFMGLWPLLGAIFMGYIFYKSIPNLNSTTLAVGLGAMGLGLIPLIFYWIKGVPYFDMPTKLDRVAQLEELQEMEVNL
ncbi:MAG: APC family permease [Acidimicrobiaceae bacterium]|nr:APC family permease [Acidimicrobiaceae bacterium]